MMWSGIDQQLSSVADKPGVSEYQQNTRMTVAGELQRRPGMAPANFSPTGSAAIGMVGAFPTSGPYGVTVDTAGSISGFPITGPIWEPPKLKPPIAQGTQWTISLPGSTQGSCPGTITVSVNASAGGTVSLWRQVFPSGAIAIFHTRVFNIGDPALVIYDVPVPWSIDYLVIDGSLTGFVSASAFGASSPGCG